MQDVTNRTLRTGGQAAFAEGLIQLAIAFGAPITPDQHAALLVVLVPLITLIWNWLEILAQRAKDRGTPAPPAAAPPAPVAAPASPSPVPTAGVGLPAPAAPHDETAIRGYSPTPPLR
jgi:hypothetical protein